MPASSDSGDDGFEGDQGLFQEPADYFQPEKPSTSTTHTLLSGQTLTVRLIGHSPLWGHLLWNAGKVVSDYVERNASLVEGKPVLELGAGAGLPSLTCATLGARQVVVTDYPDAELIENLEHNIRSCFPTNEKRNIRAQGYLWGAPTDDLTAQLDDPKGGFDLLILADVLFNHSEHAKLVASIRQTLKQSPHACALVFFTPYRPWLLDKDLTFFPLAEEAGFTHQKVVHHVMDKVMFEEDRGDELLRRTVFGYELRWKDNAS